jgi:hypothetical protein
MSEIAEKSADADGRITRRAVSFSGPCAIDVMRQM